MVEITFRNPTHEENRFHETIRAAEQLAAEAAALAELAALDANTNPADKALFALQHVRETSAKVGKAQMALLRARDAGETPRKLLDLAADAAEAAAASFRAVGDALEANGRERFWEPIDEKR